MNSNKYTISCYPFFTFCSSGLFAETANNTPALLGLEDAYPVDLPVVISATQLKQPINETPALITIIGRRVTDASGAQTIPDLLPLLPEFSLGNMGGVNPLAIYHGQNDHDYKRAQQLIDNRLVYQSTLAGVCWSDLITSIDDIERIKIIHGPDASAYANSAVQSVFSTTTEQPPEDLGHYLKKLHQFIRYKQCYLPFWWVYC